jgi:hypothetical protein
MSTRCRSVVAFVLLSGLLAACSSDREDTPPAQLASSAELQHIQNQRNKWTYRKLGVDYSRYRRFHFEPVVVYAGPDGAFGSIPTSERRRLADIVGEEVTRVMRETYSVVDAPGPDVIRIRLTLLGVDETVGGVATITRVLPVGIAANAIRGVAGAPGSLTGSIELAMEVFDSQSNDLLAAAIRRITPAVYDVEATLSTTETVRSSARNGANLLRDAIETMRRR